MNLKNHRDNCRRITLSLRDLVDDHWELLGQLWNWASHCSWSFSHYLNNPDCGDFIVPPNITWLDRETRLLCLELLPSSLLGLLGLLASTSSLLGELLRLSSLCSLPPPKSGHGSLRPPLRSASPCKGDGVSQKEGESLKMIVTMLLLLESYRTQVRSLSTLVTNSLTNWLLLLRIEWSDHCLPLSRNSLTNYPPVDENFMMLLRSGWWG